MLNLKNKNSGFTLIELLIVVLIIGILATGALPQYQKAVVKSRLAAIRPVMAAIKQAEEAYYLANGEYTNDITKLDLEHGCKQLTEDTFVCDNYFAIDPLGNLTDFYISASYCPNYLTNWGNCSSNRDFIYIVWFENSAHPNQIQCSGSTILGKAVCKGLE